MRVFKWYAENGLKAFGVAREDILRAYFLAAACIFEPTRATERLSWARVSVLANIISKYLGSNLSGKKMMERFTHNSLYEGNCDASWLQGDAKGEILVKALQRLIDLLVQESLPVDEGPMYIQNLLQSAWIEWMTEKINTEDDVYGTSSVVPTGSCMVPDKETCLLLVKIIEISAGRIGEAASMINNKDGTWFMQLSSSICDNLHHKMLLSEDAEENKATISHMDRKIDLGMQELAQNVLREDDDKTNKKTKQTFLSVVKSCYYATHCPPYIVDRHVSKVIFEHVV